MNSPVQAANISSLSQLRVLVLNADHSTIGTIPKHISWAEAITLVITDRVTVLAKSGLFAHSPTSDMEVPWVVAVRQFQKKEMLAALANFNRWHLFLRDEGTCQYTGERLYLKSADPARKATVDHVVPVSRGGRNAWDNCVLASSEINGKKGSKLPAEAGLILNTKLHAPRVIDLQASWYRLNKATVPDAWKQFCEDTYTRWHVAA